MAKVKVNKTEKGIALIVDPGPNGLDMESTESITRFFNDLSHGLAENAHIDMMIHDQALVAKYMGENLAAQIADFKRHNRGPGDYIQAAVSMYAAAFAFVVGSCVEDDRLEAVTEATKEMFGGVFRSTVMSTAVGRVRKADMADKTATVH